MKADYAGIRSRVFPFGAARREWPADLGWKRKGTIMDVIARILESFRGTLPQDSKTYAAIARGAAAEEISACASEEGLHALAGALFEACEEGGGNNARLDSVDAVAPAVGERLRQFREQLPPGCATARLIDAGARLDEISEAAEQEGLTSLAAMLVEAEQEQGGRA
ncbi:MAG TPA: hypothetical protein VFY24_16220 [Azospira sp.]|nr:hypothetical protein [Azospira sp.]